MFRHRFDVHGCVHHNKMPPCIRIYYSIVSWLLNMFRATPLIIRSSRTVLAVPGFTCMCGCRPLSAEITNKMRPCTRIYYSNISWLLNMFRAKHRSSSGTQELYLQSLVLHASVVAGRLERPATTHACKTRDCKYSSWAPDDEQCASRNMLSNQETLEE
jgi:hypothetical protein